MDANPIVLQALTIFTAAASGGAAEWVRQSPQPWPPGAFVSVAYPEPDHVFALSAGTSVFDDALFESFDGGFTWIRSELGAHDSFHQILFVNTDLGFIIGNGFGSNLRSTDGGSTWQPLPQEVAPFTWFGISFITPDDGRLIGNGCAAFTHDGGVSWEYAMQETAEGLLCLGRVQLATPDRMIGVTDEFLNEAPEGIYLSEDGGMSWDLVFAAEDVNGIAWFDKTTAAAMRDSGALRSTDGGETWSAVPTPGTGFFPIVILNGTTAISQRLGAAGSEILRTTDAGASWDLLSVPLNGPLSDIEMLDEQSGLASIFLGGDQHSMFRTTDAGATWSPVGLSPAPATLAIDFIDELNGVAVGTDNIRLVSSDGGITWERISSGTLAWLYDIEMKDSSTGFAAGDDWILRTTDGGGDWEYNHFLTDDMFDIDPIGGDTWVAVGTGGRFEKSTDGGQSWSTDRINVFVDNTGAFFVSEAEGWVVATPARIYHTTDGGASWDLQYAGSFVVNDVSFRDSQTGVVVGPLDVILRTTDGGESWSFVDHPTGHVLNEVAFGSEDVVWAVGNFGAVIRSTDAGATWQQLPAPTDVGLASVDALSADEAWVTGIDDTVLNTTDGGQTWTVETTASEADPFDSYFAIDAIPAGDVWVCGEFGGIMRRTSDEPSLPGDIDGDGSVGFSDLLIVLSAWGDCPPPPADCAADVDGDGAVGFSDLLIVLSNWS